LQVAIDKYTNFAKDLIGPILFLPLRLGLRLVIDTTDEKLSSIDDPTYPVTYL
jgi:hypothetical protein